MNEQSHADAPTGANAVPDEGTIDGRAVGNGDSENGEALAEIEALQSEIAALKDEVLRLRAEIDNQRKRAQRDLEAAHKYAIERFVQELLPLKDGLDLGLSAAQSATEVESLRQGMALSMKQLSDFFAKLNIREINPVGERFNPEFHQAMTVQETSAVLPGTVVGVMQSGYLLHDRLLRPALVVVAKAPEGASA